jgi:hypothetical protein
MMIVEAISARHFCVGPGGIKESRYCHGKEIANETVNSEKVGF